MSVIERIEWGRHGPRVVLVHGDIFDASAVFAAMEPLAADHRLVLVNRRGFGASPAVDGRTSTLMPATSRRCSPRSRPISWDTLTAASCL
jgi:pimeloyl-ACP methyl ester carboxylesterase